jgi:hypothetical protein
MAGLQSDSTQDRKTPRDVENRAGVDGASWRGRDNAMNGVSSAGREPAKSRSQASDPIDVTAERCLSNSGSRLRAPTRPGWTDCSPPSSIVSTRKTAAGVRGARTGLRQRIGHR